MENLKRLLAVSVRKIIFGMSQAHLRGLEEIRLRAGQPLSVRINGVKYFLSRDGGLLDMPYGAYTVSGDECTETISHATEYSVYASDRTVSKGYITVKGGIRIGVAGECICDGNGVKSVKNIMSLCIRVPRQVLSAADRLADYVLRGASTVGTLIVSPPGMGKTTMLRELARLASERGRNVAVVDERSEIAACSGGVAQFKLGPRCDVLDGVSKAEGIMMTVRAMSPDVIVTDEIGREEDADAILNALSSGVKVFASLHGNGLGDVLSKSFIDALIAEKAFGAYVFLSPFEVGKVDRILNADLRDVELGCYGEKDAQYCF